MKKPRSKQAKKPRSKPAPLSERARDVLALRREAQRVLLARLRGEEGRRRFGVKYLAQSTAAAAAGISADHLSNFESGDKLLSEEMRARLIVAYGLTPSQWAAHEKDIVETLERSDINFRQQELFVAEKRASRGGGSKSDEP